MDWIKISISILLLGITFLIYGNTFHAGFHFDDYAYIIESKEIQNINYCLNNLYYHFFRPDRMLVTLTFAINYHVHGLSLPGYHLVNIVFHALNGIILFMLMIRAMSIAWPGRAERRNYLLAGAVSVMFLLHPVAVNSVTYISQRHVLMATLFYQLAMLFFLSARSIPSRLKPIYWLGVAVCFWCAIHSKQMSLTIPLALLALEWLLFQNASLPESKWLWQRALPVVSVFVVILGIYAVRADLFSTSSELAGFLSGRLWTPWQHAMTESIVFLHYWKILLCPLTIWLSVDHYFPLSVAFSWQVGLSWIVHAVIFFIVMVAIRKKYLLGAFGGMFFYIVLVPPYFALPIADVMVDYKTYLPAIGFMFIYAEFGRFLLRGAGTYVFVTIIVLSLVFYGTNVRKRNSVFRTEIDFWSDVIRKYPQEPRPHNNRGLAYSRKGNYRQAIEDFNTALLVDPSYAMAYGNQGDAYLATGDVIKARQSYEEYLDLVPGDADGYVRLANVFSRTKQWDKARDLYLRAVEIDGKNVGALYNLGLAHGYLGDIDEAEQLMHKVLTIDSHYVNAISSLGSLNLLKGRFERGIDYFQQALDINPEHTDSLYNLAICYLKQDDLGKAARLMERLKAIDPKRAEPILKRLNRH